MSIHPKAALTRTSSDGDFSAGCVLVPIFSLFICHSVISHLIFLSGWFGWLGRLGYPRYVYGAYMFVDDCDDEQATVCISFPSQFVSSDEIAINLNRAPVPTVRHGQGDAPYLVSCNTYVSSASQGCRDQQRATSAQYIICLLRGPNDETTSPGPCVHEVVFLCRRTSSLFVNSRS